MCATSSFAADVITDHPYNNVPENVFQKLGVNLHLRPDHPLGILKDAIYSYFDQQFPGVYKKFDDLYPVVSTQAVSASQLPIPRSALHRPNRGFAAHSPDLMACVLRCLVIPSDNISRQR